jgi:phage baseplate assembly protein W
MTTIFDKPLNGFRFVETRYGDTLQAIAARELGDAARWVDLIAFNGLVPPYLTDDPTAVADGVLLTGSLIKLPAPVAVVSAATEPDLVFGRDISLNRGQLFDDGSGDLAVVAGRENLKQAIKNRIDTERGELLFHLPYGSLHRRLIGTVNGPTAALLAAQYVKSALQDESRIRKVNDSTANVAGDVVSVTVEVQPVTGKAVSVTSST